MKIKIFLILCCVMQVLFGFSQRDSLYEWKEIQHNIQNLTVHYQLRPKIPFYKQGDHRVFLKLENSSNVSMRVIIQLHISAADMVSDLSIYSATIELNATEKRIGRRGGVVFNPKKIKPLSQEFHFVIQKENVSSTQSLLKLW